MKIYKKYHDSGDNGRLYRIWKSMKKRCYTLSQTGYKNYGGRGIKVCDIWKNNFMSFYEWSINNGYTKNLTIERKDNDGNYEPGNCRWATMKEQAQNKRKTNKMNTNTVIIPNNMTVNQFLSFLNISEQGFYWRVRKGWNIERILNTPPQRYKNRKTKNN